jgi:hypothetical protein
MTGGRQAGTKPRSSPHTSMSVELSSTGSVRNACARHRSSWRLRTEGGGGARARGRAGRRAGGEVRRRASDLAQGLQAASRAAAGTALPLPFPTPSHGRSPRASKSELKRFKQDSNPPPEVVLLVHLLQHRALAGVELLEAAAAHERKPLGGEGLGGLVWRGLLAGVWAEGGVRGMQSGRRDTRQRPLHAAGLRRATSSGEDRAPRALTAGRTRPSPPRLAAGTRSAAPPPPRPAISPHCPPLDLSPRVERVRVLLVPQQAHILPQRQQPRARRLDLGREPLGRALPHLDVPDGLARKGGGVRGQR